MARLPRIVIPGVPAHVYVRGNDRQAIFRSEGDRVFLHRCLVETSRKHGLQVHAYVFMSNHLHLLATPEAPASIARTVQGLGRRYVSYYNYLHGRTGTLWEGRHRSSIVQADRHFLTVMRYIEMNPVRACMVGLPVDHPWSSHRCNIGATRDDLVTPHATYLGLAAEPASRSRAYLKLFDSPLEAGTLEAIRKALFQGAPLGDAAFCAKVEAKTGRRIPRPDPGRPRINSNGV